MTYARSLLFHFSAIVLGPVWFSLLVTAWSTGLGLLVTLLGLPVIWLTLAMARELAEGEARLARELLGARVAAPPRLAGWRLLERLRNGAMWRAQAYLLARFAIGFPIGVALLCAWSTALSLIVAPAWYWALPEGIQFGLFNVDRLWEAFAVIPLGVVAVFASMGLTQLSDTGWRALAERLLPAAPATDPAARLPRVVPPLKVTAATMLALELLCVLVWGLTGRTSPWPAWTALGLFIPVGVQASFAARALVPWPRWRDWATHAGVSVVAFIVCLGAWAIPGGDYFWPVWPLLGMTTALSVKALITYGARSGRREMAPRMEQLQRTRAGVVDARDDELTRIERDLHDGAQARLVAMSMSLGLAEERLDRDPESARELMVEAQEQARTAIRELRDLARGIAPPVLADRGLQAAIEALAASSVLPIQVTGTAGERPGPSVERAAYFVAAEALANAAKHAGASRIVVTLARTGDELLVEVSDDGRGGADPHGNGLAGLRRRVEAIDGRLEVGTPAAGEGTIIRASLPCASS